MKIKFSSAPLGYYFLQNYYKFPNNNAIFVDDKYYSYKQLYNLVSSIYYEISKIKGLRNIIVTDNNDIYTYASMLAVSLLNKTYVPISLNNPYEYNKNIIEKTKSKFMLTSSLNDEYSINYINTKTLKETSKTEIKCDVNKNNDAYIIFTSGTTGKPKGVKIKNSMVNYLFDYYLSKEFKLNENDRFLQIYDITFDVSVFSFFFPLYIGACTYIVPKNNHKYLSIIKLLEENKITVVSLIPSVLDYVSPYFDSINLPELRYNFFSGDKLYEQTIKKWSNCIPNSEIYNFYGPTETTIVNTVYKYNRNGENLSENGIISIGKPIKKNEYFILKNKGEEIGELCFRGEQTIKSYLNNTNKNKFCFYKGEKYYRTGDVVRKNKDGNLLFVGRTDKQVKINGFRIEIPEIEFYIKKYFDVPVAVLKQSNKNNIDYLIAFIEQEKELNIEQELRKYLPDYKIPKEYYYIKKFPLNNNGKICEKELRIMMKK